MDPNSKKQEATKPANARESIGAAIDALKADAAQHEENARAIERLQDALVYLDNRDARLAAATDAPGT